MAKTLNDIEKIIAKQLTINNLAYHRQFSSDFNQKVAQETPVKDGYATANWHIDIETPNLRPLNFTDKTNAARPTQQRAITRLRSLKPKQDVFISNAVQGRDDETGQFTGEGYIVGLEHGKSNQAPNGMVQKNIALAQAISKRSIKKVFR